MLQIVSNKIAFVSRNILTLQNVKIQCSITLPYIYVVPFKYDS